MRHDRSSLTAAWVSTWRGLGEWLPDGARLAVDPFGLACGTRVGALLLQVPPRRRPIVARALLTTRLRRLILWMQIRTRMIDDVLLDFTRAGGKQVLILGAGFDCRAARFREVLGRTQVFEVDHPATQQSKVRLLHKTHTSTDHVRFIPWEFELNSMRDLPLALAEAGHDRLAPTLTIWEGVVMYLSREAVVATLDAVARWSAPRSLLVFNYTEPRRIAAWRAAARLVGERVRPGWTADEMRELAQAHGLPITWDRRDDDLARELLGAPWAARFRGAGGRIALARPASA